MIKFEIDKMKIIDDNKLLKDPSADEALHIQSIVSAILQSDAFIARYRSVHYF